MRIKTVTGFVTAMALHGCGKREIEPIHYATTEAKASDFRRKPQEIVNENHLINDPNSDRFDKSLTEEAKLNLFRDTLHHIAYVAAADMGALRNKENIVSVRDKALGQLEGFASTPNGERAFGSARSLINGAAQDAIKEAEEYQKATEKRNIRKLPSSLVANMKAIESRFSNGLEDSLDETALANRKEEALIELGLVDLTGSPNLEQARDDIQKRIQRDFEDAVQVAKQRKDTAESEESHLTAQRAIDVIVDHFKSESVAVEHIGDLDAAVRGAVEAMKEVANANADQMERGQEVVKIFEELAVGRIKRKQSVENDHAIVARAEAAGSLDILEPLPEFPPSNPRPFKVPRLPEQDAQLHPLIHEMLNDQLAKDSEWPNSAPYLWYDSEILGDGTRIKVGTLISQRVDAMVFHVESSDPALPGPGKVIKYQSNCRSLEASLLDLERDYWFLKKVENMGISPKALFLSPPADIPNFMTKKIAFKSGRDELMTCAQNPRAYVRYMVMDVIPETVWPLMLRYLGDRGDRFFVAMNMAISVIQKLDKLHALGIIHGDIHVDNIARLDAGYENFGLIDYGKAFFEDEYRDKLDFSYWDSHCYLSSNNLKHVRFGYRDDVYKTLLAAAFLMTEVSVYNHCMKLSEKRQELVQFHESYFLFDAPGSDSILIAFPLLSLAQRDAIRGRLSNALVLSRSVVNVRDKPDYVGIVRNLRDAVQLAKNPN
jgi:hypothetical protein